MRADRAPVAGVAAGDRTRARRRGRALAGLAVVAATAAASSCSSDASTHGGDPAPVRAAVADLQHAFADQDWPDVCSRLTRSARRQASRLIPYADAWTCADDIDDAIGVTKRGGIANSARPTIRRIRLDGDRATATVALDDRTHAVPLARENGAWKVESFFGSAPADADRLAATTLEAPFPSRAATPAQVLDATGRPCFDLYAGNYPDVSGTCQLAATGSPIAVTVLTPFGRFKFADCRLRYRAWIDAQGRTWTDRFQLSSPHTNDCSDIRRCRTPDGETPPWKGRVTANDDGSFTHTMRICLRTTIGFYTGNTHLAIARTANRWQAHATNADVGNSGIRLNGTLHIKPGPTFHATPATTP